MSFFGENRRKRKTDEETTYWLSYSDMMAGLLLTFVLIIAFTMLHAQVQYDEKERQLLSQEQELMIRTDELDLEKETVATQSLQLKKQEEILASQEQELFKKEQELIAQGEKLLTQEDELNAKNILVSELQNKLAEQQKQLEDVVGVRAKLIKALKKEFDNSGLELAVDEKTGAITFQSSILFDSGKSELKPAGEDFLKKFLPRYVGILMRDEYWQYVSEIIIEGHTDTVGNYLFNLDLSQQRALSVAEYCLEDNSGILNAKQLGNLQKVLTTSGRSFSNLIRDKNGEIDMDASRRVEIQFRLTDEKMIREMLEILQKEGVD